MLFLSNDRRWSSCPNYEPPAAAFKPFFARIKPPVEFTNGYFFALPFSRNCLAVPEFGQFNGNHSFNMKKYNLLLCLPAFVLAGVLATLNYGCGNKPASSAGENPAGESKTSAAGRREEEWPMGGPSSLRSKSDGSKEGAFAWSLGASFWGR